MHWLKEIVFTRIAMEMASSFYPLSDQNGTFLLVPLWRGTDIWELNPLIVLISSKLYYTIS